MPASSHPIRGADIHITKCRLVNLQHGVKVVSAKSLPDTVTVFPFYLYSLGSESLSPAHPQEGKESAPLPRARSVYVRG